MSTGTWSLRTNSSANWLAMRPAPMMPTFVTFLASALSGAPTGRLARFCTRSKAYMDAANWSPDDEVGEGLVLTREALGLRAALRLVEQLERGVRATSAPCRCGSRACRGPS